MTEKEFREEAKRRGYKLIKVPKNVETVKLLPCVCGRKQIGCWNGVSDHIYFEFYQCAKCGLTADRGKNNREARINWNRVIGRAKG